MFLLCFMVFYRTMTRYARGQCLISSFLAPLLLHSTVFSQVLASPKVTSSIIECSFVEGLFKDNVFKYSISDDFRHVRLLTVTEVGGQSDITYQEDYDLFVVSSHDKVITFVDPRLADSEGILYLERLNLSTMRSSTITVESIDSKSPSLEKDPSICKRIT